MISGRMPYAHYSFPDNLGSCRRACSEPFVTKANLACHLGLYIQIGRGTACPTVAWLHNNGHNQPENMAYWSVKLFNEISTSPTLTAIYRFILMVLTFMDTSKYFFVYFHLDTSCLFYRMADFKLTYWHILLVWYLMWSLLLWMRYLYCFYCVLCQKWQNKDVQSINQLSR